MTSPLVEIKRMAGKRGIGIGEGVSIIPCINIWNVVLCGIMLYSAKWSFSYVT